ncbi:MAG: GNAT family N-acetyltransferase [Candidatus Contendobacter sp.]
MSSRQLQYLFDPASVALIGASERPGSLGEVLARRLVTGGFSGPLYWVNRRHRQIGSRPAYRRLADLPSTPELAIIATPAPTVPKLLIEAGRRDVKVVVIATPDPSSRNHQTAVFQQALRAAIQDYGVRVLGPGAGLSAPQVGLNLLAAPQTPAPGALALISQSQALIGPLIGWANAQGLGFSHIVALGQQADLHLPEFLDGLIDAAVAQVVLLILEHVEQARPFLSAARALARIKPVLALRVGRGGDTASNQRDAIYDAALRRAGVLRLPSLRDLFATAALLARNGSMHGDQLAVISNSRCLGLLAVDALLVENGRLSRFGAETTHALRHLLPDDGLPENPLNLGTDADTERYATAVNLLLRERDTNGLLVLHAPTARTSTEAIATGMAEAVRQWRAQGEMRPAVVAAGFAGDHSSVVQQRLGEQAIPRYETPEDAVRAFMHSWRLQQNRIGLMAMPAVLPEPSSAERTTARHLVAGALAAGRDVLEPTEIVALLHAYQINATMSASAPQLQGGHSAGMQWSVRVVEDAPFGLVLLLKPAEPASIGFATAVALLPPLNLALAHQALRHTSLYRLLSEAEAITPGVLDHILELLVQVSRLIVDLGEIAELELRRIVVSAVRAEVEAAYIRLAATESATHERLAIRPYPQVLEETISLPDGSTLLIRPVRAEDEPAFIESFKQLSTEEVRMRFMHAVKELTHEEAARLTQIDYDRDMALVVFRQRPKQPLEPCGVARLMRDHNDSERVEFAIVLLRVATGIGLGSLLIRRLIRYARVRGFRELFGEILRENEPMLALCRAMGFSIAVCPEDAGVMLARLPLS